MILFFLFVAPVMKKINRQERNRESFRGSLSSHPKRQFNREIRNMLYNTNIYFYIIDYEDGIAIEAFDKIMCALSEHQQGMLKYLASIGINII